MIWLFYAYLDSYLKLILLYPYLQTDATEFAIPGSIILRAAQDKNQSDWEKYKRPKITDLWYDIKALNL